MAMKIKLTRLGKFLLDAWWLGPIADLVVERFPMRHLVRGFERKGNYSMGYKINTDRIETPLAEEIRRKGAELMARMDREKARIVVEAFNAAQGTRFEAIHEIDGRLSRMTLPDGVEVFSAAGVEVVRFYPLEMDQGRNASAYTVEATQHYRWSF